MLDRLSPPCCFYRRRAVLIVLCLIPAGDIELYPGQGDQLTGSNTLTFSTWNIQSVRFAEMTAVLRDIIANRSIDLMALTETWIRRDDPPAITNAPAPPCYNVINAASRQSESSLVRTTTNSILLCLRPDFFHRYCLHHLPTK